ncbi:MAG: prepilin-type N-terminal cleavage/methylation domain-containing protein [Xanthomonadales bacterium]|nr:hypothetical protein [Xanthomonadales bacterium]MCC6593079.1 prepilin-type N-terminal cleavage/methylation domain-containing protein [Xanthomonadales bacterium]
MSIEMHLRSPQRGFTLVELMIAMAIGLIATIGIVSLFGGTSRTNQLQEGLARLQENGRYAAMRIEDDLRMASALYCSTTSGNRLEGAVAPMWSDLTPWVYAENLNLPDSGGMRSVDALGVPSNSNATTSYGLSPRFFLQGYTCTTGTSCAPALRSPSMFPAAGLADGNRVPNSDIVTIRYLRGSGWPMTRTDVDCASGISITLNPQTGDDPVNFPSANGLAMLGICGSPAILPIASASGNTLNVGTLLANPDAREPRCSARPERDVRIFNFATDFVTVTYYLAFRANDDPDARDNSGAGALIPTLIRRENGVEQELVRGVDQLTLRYGVRDSLGNMRFLTAEQVDNQMAGAIACPPKPQGVAPNPANVNAMEPGCLWRSVRRIEAHLLVNPGSEVGALDDIGRSFRFMNTTVTNPAETATLPSGLALMNFPRREFVAHATHRNKTP